MSLARAWALFRDPVTPEKRALLSERWSRLAPELRLPGQGLGQKATGCGATIGVQPRCDFACTGCYLGAEANRIPALSVDEVLDQINALRRYLGPKSNVQITDGEVTLRPVEELIAILRHAIRVGAIPMVMTHGDTLRRKPGLLEQLMIEGGLTEISIHVDTTQRGRDGYRDAKTELDLMPLRDEFAAMIRSAKRSTNRRIRAATTMTITDDNLPFVHDVVEWTIQNRDAFSLISFQPLAQVGRTRKHLAGVSAAELWQEVAKATAPYGAPLESAQPMHFGHPDCTRFVPMLALQKRGEQPRLVQLIRDVPEDVAVMEEYFESGIAGAAFRDDAPIEMIGRAAGMVASNPRWFAGRVRRWASARFLKEAGMSMTSALWQGSTGRLRVDGVTLTSHHFMSPEETGTATGRARLEACVFRIPVDGEMVPMCRVNAEGIREKFYADIIRSRAAENAPTADHGRATYTA